MSGARWHDFSGAMQHLSAASQNRDRARRKRLTLARFPHPNQAPDCTTGLRHQVDDLCPYSRSLNSETMEMEIGPVENPPTLKAW